eukprot:3001173-Pyramimonas_sp.AAC.1
MVWGVAGDGDGDHGDDDEYDADDSDRMAPVMRLMMTVVMMRSAMRIRTGPTEYGFGSEGRGRGVKTIRGF